MKKVLLHTVMLTVTVLFLAACGNKTVPDAKNWDIENFTFTDQDGNSFSKDDMKGKIWISDFVFTNCTTVCLPMTSNLLKLREQLDSEGIENVEFVSFSVDPEIDTPEVMKEYFSKLGVDFSRWHFLTGYSQKEIEAFALENFKVLVQKPDSSDQVAHGTSFSLVDEEGTIIQNYSGIDVPYDEIIKHIKILQNY